MKESFVLYTEYKKQIDLLTMEQRGQLLTAIMEHETGGTLPDMDALTAMAYSMIETRLVRDAERYEEKVEARRAAGRQGGRPRKEDDDKAKAFSEKAKKANGFSEKQTKAKKADPVPVPVPVPVISNKYNAQEAAPYQEVIDYLNRRCGTKYQATTAKTRELIRARHREGRTLDDFKKVIDRKAREWLNTPNAIYLRPETLFGSKFDGYLNAPEARMARRPAQAFNEFHQRDYDYEDLQKALLQRQLGGA